MKKNSLLVIFNDYSEQVLQGREMKKVYFPQNRQVLYTVKLRHL